MKEQYIPTAAEIQKAESMMSMNQIECSIERVEDLLTNKALQDDRKRDNTNKLPPISDEWKTLFRDQRDLYELKRDMNHKAEEMLSSYEIVQSMERVSSLANEEYNIVKEREGSGQWEDSRRYTKEDPWKQWDKLLNDKRELQSLLCVKRNEEEYQNKIHSMFREIERMFYKEFYSKRFVSDTKNQIMKEIIEEAKKKMLEI